MPRRWGARAARHARERIASAKGIPSSDVSRRKILARIKTEPITVSGNAFPGTKVKAKRGGLEPAESMLRRLKATEKKIRAPEGVSKTTTKKRKNKKGNFHYLYTAQYKE